ncbi:MAG: hypothetical protein C9356_20090 [Oleiphilus sp.]|nr:MAG: hypothetical protein C9356_20090 [Oleiphilus sp.]
MTKYWPSLDEYRSMSTEEREGHKQLLIRLQKASLMALVIIGVMYVYQEGFIGAMTTIGMCSGGVGLYLLGMNKKQNIGLVGLVTGIMCALIIEIAS